MKFIIKLCAVAAALLLAARYVDGITIENFWPSAVLAAVIFGVLNAVVKPVVKLFALPVSILTLGVFSLVINVVIFWLITFVPGVTISGFMPALWGLIIVSVVAWIVDLIFSNKDNS
ncbi:MAG: phage holin family protein [Parcubacteria group bacterium]|jgi:putative membrane protein